jgi:hypothetical protein
MNARLGARIVVVSTQFAWAAEDRGCPQWRCRDLYGRNPMSRRLLASRCKEDSRARVNTRLWYEELARPESARSSEEFQARHVL